MELPMIYKISPRPSFPKRGRKRPTRLREDPKKMNLRPSAEDIAERIDIFIATKAGISRSQARKLFDSSLVLVNGIPRKPNYRLKKGDGIELSLPEKPAETLGAEDIPLKILYMDESLVVVEKPRGMVVYPSYGHAEGTLMNAIAFHSRKLASVGGPLRPGVVHRLDKDTSGVMVVALDDRAYYGLIEQFRKRSIERRYIALVYGTLKGKSGEIALGIGRSASDRKKMSTKAKRKKEAVTRWDVMKRFKEATLIHARLGTGRTHQIRVHFSSIGHPVLGDKTYGKKTGLIVKGNKVHFPRQMLHAELLGFAHPITGKYMEFSSPPPEDMEEAIMMLENNAKNT
jgi:23S rRNA pseudouridine1911/1915/1917 synthase